jgi:predicted NBD/HSP70 family sugar kinase
VGRQLELLLQQAGRTSQAVRGTALALPGPVEASAGRLVRPPGLPGWSEVPIRPHLTGRWPVPVSVDNDVNAMAVAEHRAAGLDDSTDVLLVKVSTGIGAGLVLGGRIHRGAVGAAGDIGHTAVHDADGVVCRCGNVGCLEAVASGSAVVRQLVARGRDVSRVADVVALVDAGDAEAHGLVRLAGRRLGEVLAQAVNLLNPSVLVLAGDLALAQEPLLAGVREAVYARATTLAARDLEIRPGVLGEQAGLVGCAVTVLDQVLAADAVDRALARLHPVRG